jgi:hypothetical protein
VWRELCDLLSGCPTQYHKHTAVACLLSHLLDDDSISNDCLIDSIQRTRKALAYGKKPCGSVFVSDRYLG